MKTFEEQRNFFLGQWPALETSLRDAGSEGLRAELDSFEDRLERSVLYMFLRQKLGMGEGADFGAYRQVIQHGIGQAEAEAAKLSEKKDKKKRLQFAHILAFNLGADLAPCWPGDLLPRTEEDYEAGLWAGHKALELAERMGSDPATLANDYWLLGVHEFALGDYVEARQAWTEGVAQAWVAAGIPEEQRELNAEAPFGVLLLEAKRSLACLLLGDPEGRIAYEACLQHFWTQLKDSARADDAGFGIAQCEELRQRFVDKS